VETAEYLPFGELRESTGSWTTDYKFTDHELDTETGLYNFNARLYDPAVGRFISPDPAVPYLSDSTNPRNYDPQMFNRYAYCRSNPLIYVDPSGLEDDDIGGILSGYLDGTDEDHTIKELWSMGQDQSIDSYNTLFEGFSESYNHSYKMKSVESVLVVAKENRNRTTIMLDLASFLCDLAYPLNPPAFYAGGQISAATNLQRTKEAYELGLAEEIDVDICILTTSFGSLPGTFGAPLSGFQLAYDIGRINGWW